MCVYMCRGKRVGKGALRGCLGSNLDEGGGVWGSSQWSMGCNFKDFYNTYLPAKINSHPHPTPFPACLEFHQEFGVMSPAREHR